MERGVLEKYVRAGNIAKEAKKLAATLMKPGLKVLDIAEKIESKILELGGGLAFPTDISINEIAAHYSPVVGDKLKLKAGDLVKVDIGVHVEGYVADTAISFSVGKNKENEALIKAADAARSEAIKMVKSGVNTRDIGKKIEETISKQGFRSIQNLRGHGLERYEVHSDITIPNCYVKKASVLSEGDVIAIEPFPTTGEGFVIPGKGSEVYALISKGQIRQGREVLTYIQNEYKTLPFSKRALVKKFGLLKANLVLKQLLQKSIIQEYPILREKRNGKVAQMEHTMIVEKSGARVIT